MGLLKGLLARVAGRIDLSAPGSDLLYVVFDRLKAKLPAGLRQPDPSMVSIQEDIVASELMPVAALRSFGCSVSHSKVTEWGSSPSGKNALRVEALVCLPRRQTEQLVAFCILLQ